MCDLYPLQRKGRWFEPSTAHDANDLVNGHLKETRTTGAFARSAGYLRRF
jgi:hypothetical protein